MARKLGCPGNGNACDDSIDAKEKIRLSFRDNAEMCGSSINI
jgi:hypothetical protein